MSAMARRSSPGAARVSDIGPGLHRSDQTLDGAIGEIDEGADQDEDSDHQPHRQDADDAEAEPDPEGVNGVLEMAFPDRAAHLVALDIGEDDAGDARQPDAQKRGQIKSVDHDDECTRIVAAHGGSRWGRDIAHPSLPRTITMWGGQAPSSRRV